MHDQRDAVDPTAWFDSVDLATLRARGGAKWSKYGPDVLAAWVADMDFPPVAAVRSALDAVLERGSLGYPWLLEHNPVADGFADWARRRHGWEIDPSLVVNTIDVLQPMLALIELYSEPGDGIVVQDPIYPPFRNAIIDAGRVVVENRLGTSLDPSAMDLEGLAAGTDERTRVVLLCNPHNPTGRVFTRAELQGLADLAIERDWLVISDEIHADLIYPDQHHIPFATLGDEVAARTVTLTAATKTFNIAGLRLAIAVFGSAAQLARYQSIPRYLLGGANIMGVEASVAAWRDGEAGLDALLPYLRANRDRVVEAVAAMPGVHMQAPQATYLAWLDCRELLERSSAPNAFERFLQGGVALNDGADFGTAGEGFVRLNFATSRGVLERILDRMNEVCLASF